jgi:O-antigen ligase
VTAAAAWRHLRSAPPGPASLPGLVWTLAIAAIFFYFSNPLSMVPFFGDSLQRAVTVALVATLVTLPWVRLPRIPWGPIVVLGLMYASLWWTISWDVTWGVTLVYVKIAVVAWLCTWSTDIRTLAHGMHLGGVVVVVASIYAYREGLPFADVPLGTEGYLAGVGTNRNILAYTLAIALAFALSSIPARAVGRVLWCIGILVLGLGLFLAQSGTGFVVATVLVALAALLTAASRVPAHLVRRSRTVVAILGAVILAGGVLGLPVIGLLLGRDTTTLSGRTELWSAIWRASDGQRWLGQGWGTTWPYAWVQAPPNPRLDAITAETGVAWSHGHNSLVTVLPDLGVLGMLAIGLLHVALLVAAVLQWRSDSGSLQLMRTVLLALVALVLLGITEPLAVTPLGWTVLVMLSALVVRRRGPVQAESARYLGKNETSATPAAEQATS